MSAKTLSWGATIPTLGEAEIELRRAQVGSDYTQWTAADWPVVEAALALARQKKIRRTLKRSHTLPKETA